MHRLAGELGFADEWVGGGEFRFRVSEFAQAPGGGQWVATEAFVTAWLYLCMNDYGFVARGCEVPKMVSLPMR